MSLSVIIIARNAEATLRRCLESVAWAEEIVLVECGSTDRTVEIAREYTRHVHQTPDFPGFGAQKNRALDRATGDWILALDSDEWVTPELRAGIEAVMAAPGDRVAWVMPRRSSFCGRFMRHSGWWPDYVMRLWRRGQARFAEDHAHDRAVAQGPRGRLKQPLMHEAVVDLEQMVAKTNLYSSLGARMLHEQGRRASVLTGVLHGLWAFFRTYFLRLGFLDGREGFLLAVINAEGSYYRYAKLALLGKPRKLDDA
jgi:glycosyltransferase involved in cell wall biosynthesis